MRKVVLFLTAFLFACGGGKEEVELSFSLSPSSVESSYEGLAETTLKISLSSSDVVAHKVEFKKVELVYEGFSGEERRESIPLGFSINGKGERSVKLTLYSSAYKLIPPYVYLTPNNPSSIEFSVQNQELARPVGFVVGIGDGSSRSFTRTLETPVSVGTCKAEAGSVVLEETAPGILSGSGGSGTVSESSVSLSFSSPVPTGTGVILKCLTKMGELLRDYSELMDLVFSYGTKGYSVKDGLVYDGSVVIGRLEGKRFILLSSIGFQNAPFVASYKNPERGGELAGYGNGGKLYTLRTKYAPLKEDSVKVYAKVGDSLIVCGVVRVNALAGEVSVQCSDNVPSGSPLYVEYMLKEVVQKVRVFVDTSLGRYSAGEVLLRIKP